MVEETLGIKATPITRHTSTRRLILFPKMHEHDVAFEGTNTSEIVERRECVRKAESTYHYAAIIVRYVPIPARFERKFRKVLPKCFEAILLVNRSSFSN